MLSEELILLHTFQFGYNQSRHVRNWRKNCYWL